MSALQITSTSQGISVEQSLFEHEAKNLFGLPVTVDSVEKRLMFQKEADEVGVFRVLFKEIDQLFYGVLEERPGFLHTLLDTLFSPGDDSLKLSKVVPFILIGGFTHLRFELEVRGAVDLHLVNIFSQLHGLMENGADGEIEKPFIPVNRPFWSDSEKGVALLFQVVEKALATVIDPIPDI